MAERQALEGRIRKTKTQRFNRKPRGKPNMASNAETQGKKPSEVFGELAIKAGWKLTEQNLEDIDDVLAGCTEDEIINIAKHLRQNGKYATPRMGEIKEARQLVKPEHAGIPIAGKKQPWDIREEKIYGIVSEYCREFERTPEYRQAEREGWDLDFERFIRSTAITMAEMIYGYIAPGKEYSRWGWDGMCVSHRLQGEYQKMLKSCHATICREGIDVMKALPGGQIPIWRERAKRPKEIKPQSDYSRHLDNIIAEARARKNAAA